MASITYGVRQRKMLKRKHLNGKKIKATKNVVTRLINKAVLMILVFATKTVFAKS